jgi:hypothetical protein
MLEPFLGVTINHSFDRTGGKTFQDLTFRTFGQLVYYPTGTGYFSYGISGLLNLEQNTMDLFHINLDEFVKTIENNEEVSRDVYGSETFLRLADKYRVDSILLAYGVPEKIYTFGEVYDPSVPAWGPDMFYVWLLYPEKGIMVEYQMLIKDEKDKKGSACLRDSFINMYLFRPDKFEFFTSMVSDMGSVPPYHSSDLSIEEALKMTTQQFHTEYSKADAGCLEVPLDIWPEH